MKNFILMLVVMLALACQTVAAPIAASHDQTVVSAFLGENYIVALLSVLVLVLTMMWELWWIYKTLFIQKFNIDLCAMYEALFELEIIYVLLRIA